MRELLENYPDVLDLKQVKDILGVSKNYTYTLIKEIGARKIGKGFKVLKKDLIRYLTQGENNE